MGLEAGSFIPELNANNPLGADPKSEGDDHIRLVKRCTLGSFPAFVGNTATPKSVTLTEDQISDAALASAAQVVTGLWNFQSTDVRFQGHITLNPLNSSYRMQNFAQTTDVAILARSNTSDALVIGNSLWTSLLFQSGDATGMTFSVNGGVSLEEAFRATLKESGGLLVRDMLNVGKKAGFRNPTHLQVTTNLTLVQGNEGQILRIATSANDITVPALEAGTAIRILNGGGVSNTRLLADAGITLRWYDGGGGSTPTGTRLFAAASVCELYWRSPTDVDIFGNGLS